jgi:hypothetical protein
VQQAAFRLVVAVADQQPWRLVPRVQNHAVGGVELLQVIARRAKVLDVFPRLVELENMVAGVTV